MNRVTIKHNPYSTETSILIDGNIPSEDSDLSVLIYKEQRISKWISLLPECLTNECDEEEYEFEYFGIKEDYDLIKQSLEEAECVASIEFKGGFYEVEEMETMFSELLDFFVDNFSYDDEEPRRIQSDFLKKESPFNDKAVSFTYRSLNAKKAIHEYLMNCIERLNYDEKIEQYNAACSIIQAKLEEAEKTQKLKEDEINQIELVDITVAKDVAIYKYNEEWQKKVKSLRPKKSEFFAKSALVETNNLYAIQLEDAINTINQMVASYANKDVRKFAEDINIKSIYLSAPKTELIPLPTLKLKQIKCPILSPEDIVIDETQEAKALQKARKAKKAAKIVGAVSAVAVSPIGAVAAVTTNAIANKQQKANGINARVFFMSLVNEMEESFEQNYEEIKEFYSVSNDSINDAIINAKNTANEQLNVFLDEQLATAKNEMSVQDSKFAEETTRHDLIVELSKKIETFDELWENQLLHSDE